MLIIDLKLVCDKNLLLLYSLKKKEKKLKRMMHWKAAITCYELAKVKVKLNCTEVSVRVLVFILCFYFLFLVVSLCSTLLWSLSFSLFFFGSRRLRALVMAIEIESSWSTSLHNVKYCVQHENLSRDIQIFIQKKIIIIITNLWYCDK